MRETLKRIFRFAIPLVGPGRGRSMAMVRAVGLTAAALALCLAAPAGAQAGPDDTVAGVVTARSEGTTSLIVTMPYTGDANANNTVTVEYKLCTDVTYSSTSATHSASPYVVAINSLTANTCYDLRATYNEAGPDVVSGTNPQNIRISTTWDTTMLHNRNRFPGSTKWDANGGWGMPGTKYGQITCETCHTKGPANIKRIKETITTPDATNWASSGSSSVTVNFQSTTTPNGFGDDAGGHTTSQKVCEVCHSQNKYHNYDTADNTGGTAHNNGTDCMQCHPHSVGFIGKGDCISCHAATPSVFWSRNSAPGAHATHYGEDVWNLAAYDDSNLSQAGFYKYNCQKCHESGHSASPTPNITLSSTNAPPSSGGSFESVGKTCSTVYCHSNGLGSYPGTAAKWTDAATGDCGTCHGATYAAPPSSGSHTAHVGTGSGLQLNCSKCHNQIASVGTVADMQKHVNYAADWNLDQTDNRINDTLYNRRGSYSAVDAGSFGSKTPPSTTYGNCSNIYCHSIVQTSSGGVLTGAVGEYKTPTWGTASTGQCGTCHLGDGSGSGTTIATGSHPMHVTTYSYACTRCHNTTASQHADRSINLAFNLPYDYGATEGYTQGLTHNPGNGYGSCSNTYCHSIVQTTAGASLTGAVGQYKTVAWNTDNGSIDCTSCHDNPSASGGHLKHAGTGAGQYGFTCAQCHSGQVPPASTHTDGSINTAIASTWSGSYSGDTIPGGSSYSTCSTTYCHSKGTSVSTGTILANTSANWGTAGPLGCTSCHGNEAGNDGSGRPYYTSGSPKTNSHVAHGSQSCNGCHYTTTSTGNSITGIANHVNKLYTVNNSATADTISYTFATTGGSCNGTFGCHEASTWGGPPKNCISCHSQALGDRRQVTATGTQPDGTGGTTGGDFVRASRHVNNGTTTQIVRHWDCVVCHLEGQAAGSPGRTSADHGGVPGGLSAVDLRNVDNYTIGWAIRKDTIAADSAPKSPTSATGTGWTTPANAYASDNAYATHAGGSTTNYLCVSGFGLTVPTGTTITGVTVLLEGYGTSATVAQRQIRVGLTKTGCGIAGTAVTALQLPGTTSAADRELAIGYANYLWGNATITPAEANAASFGVLIADNDTTTGQINIDRVRIVVHPTPRDYMDRFCLGCHDADGASQITVDNSDAGLFVGAANTAATRTVRGTGNVNPTNSSAALRPFNTYDTLQNVNDLNWVGSGTTIGTFRRANYGRVLNVEDQFNSGNSSGSAYASHHNLNQFAKRYQSQQLATGLWASYTTKLGQTMSLAGETAGFYCADCHLNETNAHGSQNAWYMLGAKDGSDSDLAPTARNASDYVAGDENICYRCHAGTNYTTASASALSRYNHNACSRVDAVTEYPMANQCLGCHGGFSANTDLAGGSARSRGGLGAIHGTNENYVPTNGGVNASTTKRYRFMSGGALRYYYPKTGDTALVDADWETTTQFDCYTVTSNGASTDTWSACSGHDGGHAQTPPAARTLNY